MIEPYPDESFSSWLIRLSRLHYCNAKNFCSFYGLESLLKSPLDIHGDVSLIGLRLNLATKLPVILSDKIHDFTWYRGRSKWLYGSNRKGQAVLNSYSKFCVNCLKTKGYYQLKWKLDLFNGCPECRCYLIETCPKCKQEPSLLKADLKFHIKHNLNPFFHCWYCEYDLRKSKTSEMSLDDYNLLLKINRSYEENPVNLRYLTFLQFGIIVGVSNHKL